MAVLLLEFRVSCLASLQVRFPSSSPYCERVIGTLRRELLDHVIILGERHAARLLMEYVAYYNGSRTHLALDKDAPEHRALARIVLGLVAVQPNAVTALPVLSDRHVAFGVFGRDKGDENGDVVVRPERRSAQCGSRPQNEATTP
ncbi:MAG: integrase core domain-containing protein [Archangium sp.]|nr:integrase core domain-containing protein [Archangium sp.]